MENRHLIIMYTVIAALVAIAIYVGLKPLLTISESALQINCITIGVLVSATLILVRFVLKYSRINQFPFIKKALSYTTLAVLFIACCVGLNILILHELLDIKDWSQLLTSIPITIIISLLIYCISVIVVERKSIVKEVEETVIDEVESNESNNTTIIEHVAVKNGTKIAVIPITEIIYLQSDGDYVMIHSTKGKFLKEQTMKSFENSLPPNKFVRIHRSSIVNIDFIMQIELYEKQTQILTLKNGAQVKISLNGYRTLKDVLGL